MGSSEQEPSQLPPTAHRHWRGVTAEPTSLPAVRRELAEWAEQLGVDAERVEMMTLATYEALSNVALHAYPDEHGVLDMGAAYWRGRARVQVTVADRGRWCPEPTDRGGLGGRGLVLIRSLAEHCEVTSDANGTTVRMSWTVGDKQHAAAASAKAGDGIGGTAAATQSGGA